MGKFFFTLLSFLSWLAGYSQLVIQPGAQFKTTNDVQITLDNTGVTNNDASSDFSSSILLFKGNTNTTISGTGNWVIKKIVVDLSSYQLLMKAPVQVNNQIQFINGKIDLGTEVLTLAPGGTIEGETETNRITGPTGGFVQTTVTLDNPSSANPGKLGAIITSAQNLGTVTIKRWHHTQYGPSMVQRFYEITPANNSLLNATLRFSYLDAELNNNSEATLTIYSRTSYGTVWTNINSSAKDATLNYIEKTGLASLQQYALGSAINSSLPLTWGEVNATCLGNEVEIKWTTFQEQNIKSFVVQKSLDGNHWQDIATIVSKGSLSDAATYSYKDVANQTNALYRVQSIELNGQSEYSRSVLLKSCGTQGSSLAFFPNPAREYVKVLIHANTLYNGTLQLNGSDGKMYQSRQVQLHPGDNQITVNTAQLSPGSYIILLQTDDGIKKQIFIKQ